MITVFVLLMVGLVSSSNVCPDGTNCQDGYTCCPTKTGYACCHYPSIPAPEEQKRAPVPLVKPENSSISVVHCDNAHTCPDGATCCRTPSGQWACCMYNMGHCCRDGIHCCPFGFRCDITSTQCFMGSLSIPASPQIPAIEHNTIQVQDTNNHLSSFNEIPAEVEEKIVPVPSVKSDSLSVTVVHCDNVYSCPDGTTCCRSPYGKWSCCPYTVGQCCRDGIHCCPFSYHCDSTSTQCLRGTLRIPASPQIPAMQNNAIQNQASIIHCSNQFYCPAGNSCCKTPTGQWACCPYPLGQCCKDGKHCCEYGYDCNSSFTKCTRGDSSVPAPLTKKALLL